MILSCKPSSVAKEASTVPISLGVRSPQSVVMRHSAKFTAPGIMSWVLLSMLLRMTSDICLCRELELVRDTLMDDARERVDSLGEQATQNESLGAALDQAYAARFASIASSAQGQEEQPQPSSAEAEQQQNTLQEAGKDSRSAPAETANTQEMPQNSPEELQPELASQAPAAKEQRAAPDEDITMQPEAADAPASDAEARQAEPSAASQQGAERVEAPDESAQVGDEQQGGAAAAASVHAVPAEAAEAASQATGDAAAEAIPSPAEDAPAPSEAQGPAGDADGEQKEPEQELSKSLDDVSQRILDWHWSHLEYGCSAPLHKVSTASP